MKMEQKEAETQTLLPYVYASYRHVTCGRVDTAIVLVCMHALWLVGVCFTRYVNSSEAPAIRYFLPRFIFLVVYDRVR